MFIKAFGATLCAVVLVVAGASSAFAADVPIPGIDIIIKANPGGINIAASTTDAKGEFKIKLLAPGRYTIVLRSKDPEVAKAQSGPWNVTLLPVSRDPTPAKPVTYTAKAAGDAQQVDIVVPEGPATTYKIALTR